MPDINLDPALLKQSIAYGNSQGATKTAPAQLSANPTLSENSDSNPESLKINLDPDLLSKSIAYGADPVNQQADQIANYKAANGADAFALGVNNTFENFGRGVLKKAYEVGNAMGMDNNNQINNLNKLFQASQTQQANTAQTYPISSAAGQLAGSAAISAPIMASTAGIGGNGLAGLSAQGAIAGGTQAGLGDMTDHSISSSIIGAGLGAAGGAVGSVLGTGLAKVVNRATGVLSPEGQQAAQVFAQTGQKQPVADVVGPLAQHVFENTSDLPLAGTTAKATSLVEGSKTTAQTMIDKYNDAFNSTFGKDSLSSVQAKAYPSSGGAGNFAAQALLNDIGKDDSWTSILSQSGRIQDYAKQAAYDAARADVLQKANMVDAIPLSDVHGIIRGAIKGATNPDTGNPMAGYSPDTLTLLKHVGDDVGSMANAGGSIKYSDLANVQSTMSGILNGMYGAGGTTVTADAALVNSVKKGFDDLQLSTLSSNPQVYNTMRDLMGGQFKQLQINKSAQLANLINNTANPNDAAKQIFSQALVSKDVAAHLFDALDENGRNAAKFGFAQQLYTDMSQASTLPGDLKQSIATMTSPALAKILKNSQNFTNQFFTAEEMGHILGSMKAAHYLDNYASTFSKAPTGRIAASASKLGGLAYATAAHPYVAVPVGVGIGLFNRWINSDAGPWLYAASKLTPSSPAYAQLMQKIVQMAPQGVPQQGVNTIIPNDSSSPQEQSS